MPSKRETIIAKEIAILERKVSETTSKIAKKALNSKIDRLNAELKGIEMPARQLASSLLKARTAIKELAKRDFNELIRQLSNHPEYAFLKSMSRTEIQDDLSRKAKPRGWRFKGRNDYRVPTAAQVKSGKRSGRVYKESRPKRSDVFTPVQLAKGGHVDSEILANELERYCQINFGKSVDLDTILTTGSKKSAKGVSEYGIVSFDLVDGTAHELKLTELFDVKKTGGNITKDKPTVKKSTVSSLKAKKTVARKPKLVLKTYPSLEEAQANHNVVMEWSEGFLEENIGIDSFVELHKILKKAGFTDSPKNTYIKNKIHVKGLPYAMRIDNSKAGGSDYDFETQNIHEFIINKYDQDTYDLLDSNFKSTPSTSTSKIESEYVVVSGKDGYYTLMSKPSTKDQALSFESSLTVPRGESSMVVTVEEAIKMKNLIGKDDLPQPVIIVDNNQPIMLNSIDLVEFKQRLCKLIEDSYENETQWDVVSVLLNSILESSNYIMDKNGIDSIKVQLDVKEKMNMIAEELEKSISFKTIEFHKIGA